MIETFLTISAVLALATAIMLAMDPGAKLWAADIVARVALWTCREFRARAGAQAASRAAWASVYRQLRGDPVMALRPAVEPNRDAAGDWRP